MSCPARLQGLRVWLAVALGDILVEVSLRLEERWESFESTRLKCEIE